jgi:hypothetical protein
MLIFKRGDTFSYAGLLPDGFLPSLGWSVKSQLRDKAGRAYPLAASLDPDGSTYMLRLTADNLVTAAWPLGHLVGDVEFTSANVPVTVVSSADFIVQVVEDRTQ